MTNLEALTAKQLPELMVKLRRFITDILPIYYTADNVVRGRLSLDDVQFYVNMWPDPSCVVLVSPANCGQLYNYRTTVDIWSEDPALVISFLTDDTVLDWSKPIFFRVQYLGDQEMKQIHTMLTEKKGRCNNVERHVYVQESSPPITTALTPSYALQETLSQSDAEIVGREYSAWGVEPTDTIRYFQYCAAHLPGSSVHEENGEVVAYAALHHTSALGSVVTNPHHQRKGLGTVVVTDVCHKMKNDGQTPYVYVNPENIASVKLYEKCGFQFQSKAYRIRYIPEKSIISNT